MTKVTKSILKFVLPIASLGFFLVISIFVLIISQGKKIETDGKLTQTGIIRLTTLPTNDIKAFIDNKEVSIFDSKITSITPGIVNLKLFKEGYSNWEKNIEVESGIVKDVFAQLYPNDIAFKDIATSNINKTFYSSDGQFIYFSILDSLTDNGIWRLKLTRNLLDFANEQVPTQIIKFSNTEAQEVLSKNYNLIISPDNNKFILSFDNQYYLYSNSSLIKTNLNLLVGFNPKEVAWFNNSNSIIFLEENKYLFEYDLNSNQTTLISYFSKDNATNYKVSGENVLFIKDSKLFKYNNKTVKPFEFKSAIALKLPSKYTNLFTPLNSQNIIILESDNKYYYVDLEKDYVDIIGTNIRIESIFSSGKMILYSKDETLFTYFSEDVVGTNQVNKNIYNLGITTSEYQALQFSYSGKNIIFFKDSKISIVDFDGLNKSEILKDFNFAQNQVGFSDNGTILYGLIKDKELTSTEVNSLYKFELKID